MKFAVVQIGARYGYAAPAVLARAGVLERFYTDICGDVGLGRQLATGAGLPLIGTALSRLSARRLPEGLRARTTTFGWRALNYRWRSARLRPDFCASYAELLRFQAAMGEAIARRGFGAATHLYSTLGECGPALAAARNRGLRVVSDVYILLSAERIVARERREFPGWEMDTPACEDIRAALGFEDAMLRYSSHFLCPSPAVRDDLVANFGVDPNATAVVPYAIEGRWLNLETCPVPRRVLFVGTAELRKGIHYLAQAAERLACKGGGWEFRVAGDVSAAIARHPACRRLSFLGRIPRARIREEFAAADVLVLPSLAEGSAGVTYEALASGLPVVVTTAAGAVARDGIEGRVVPERDVSMLADAIASIVEDRPLRERMSCAARRRAAEFTWDRYGRRLLAALRDVA